MGCVCRPPVPFPSLCVHAFEPVVSLEVLCVRVRVRVFRIK